MITATDLRDRGVLPWAQPNCWLDDDGSNCDFTVDGHTFEVRDSGERGFHSGRKRWSVKCVTCGKLIHPATTGTACRVAQHLEDASYGR